MPEPSSFFFSSGCLLSGWTRRRLRLDRIDPSHGLPIRLRLRHGTSIRRSSRVFSTMVLRSVIVICRGRCRQGDGSQHGIIVLVVRVVAASGIENGLHRGQTHGIERSAGMRVIPVSQAGMVLDFVAIIVRRR